MWVLVATVVLACAAYAWWLWARRSYASTLGTTDYTRLLQQVSLCATSGSTLKLRSLETGAGVCITKSLTNSGDVQFDLMFSPMNWDELEEFRGNLELLGISSAVNPIDEAHAQSLSCLAGDRFMSQGGRVVDLALIAAGLRLGECYSQRFEGEIDSDAELEYVRDLNRFARERSATALQRRFFERILKSLGGRDSR